MAQQDKYNMVSWCTRYYGVTYQRAWITSSGKRAVSEYKHGKAWT